MGCQRALLAVLGVHLVAAAVHGSTHALVPVTLGPWLNGLVLGTVVGTWVLYDDG